MKILVLQLARFGDIYQTWPVLRALKRGEHDVHLLVRERFKGAAEGLEAIDQLWSMETREILGPLLIEKPDVDASVASLETLVSSLAAERFHQIVNLSFSPLSSRLTHLLCEQTAVLNQSSRPHAVAPTVRGYTRHADGWLDIADDASAYFYAQVGSDRANRLHLTDLFAHVADTYLQDEDWSKRPHWATIHPRRDAAVEEVLRSPIRPVLIHVGASQSEKTYGAFKWLQVVKGLLETTESPIILVGSLDEKSVAQTAANVSSSRKPIDLTGRTNFQDLFDLLKWSRLLIGADSAPVHIAALTGTPVLNLSFRSVNFWETGPKSAGSRILVFESPQDLPSDVVIREAVAILDAATGDLRAVHVPGRTEPYRTSPELAESQGWQWLRAIYMNEPFPLPENELTRQGLLRLYEANQLAMEQIDRLLSHPHDPTPLAILDRYDEILDAIVKFAPILALVVRWFQTERIRLGPMEQVRLLSRTKLIHEKFHEVLSLYQPRQDGRDGTQDEPPADTSPGERSNDHDDVHVG